MEVFLIRHTSVAVAHGTCYGHTDVPLNETFEEEAAVTKKNLDGVEFDAVYTSPLSRATRLAGFCGYPDAIRDVRLKEMNMGDWEMLRFDEIKDENLLKWYDNYLYTRTTNGESFSDLCARVSGFLKELSSQPFKTVAIFAHGGVLISAQIYAGVVPFEKGFDALTHYGGIVRIEI